MLKPNLVFIALVSMTHVTERLLVSLTKNLDGILTSHNKLLFEKCTTIVYLPSKSKSESIAIAFTEVLYRY